MEPLVIYRAKDRPTLFIWKTTSGTVWYQGLFGNVGTIESPDENIINEKFIPTALTARDLGYESLDDAS